MRNKKALDELLESFLLLGVPGCGLTISQHGQIVYQNTVGMSDRKNKIPFDTETVYRIYSCSKPITVVATLILLEWGKILLTDPVQEYLPCFKNVNVYDNSMGYSTGVKKSSTVLTILDLMRMTSGLSYGGEGNLTEQAIGKIGNTSSNTPMRLIEFCEKIAEIPLSFEPGSHWMYGFGCDILGGIIETVSGKSFGEFLKNEIFLPLKMFNTGFFLDENKRKKFAKLYKKNSKGTYIEESGLDWQFEPNALYESGGSGILSTLSDMTRFSQMLSMGGELDGVKILSQKSIELMSMDHLSSACKKDFDHAKHTIWPNMLGYSYGLGCRTMTNLPEGGALSSIGEFAWSGAAGTWSLADPKLQISAEYVHQIMPPENNLQEFCHARIRNAIYGALT